MTLEEQIRKRIEKYNKEYIRICNEQNDKTIKEMKETIEFLKEKAEAKKESIELSKIKPSKYPACHDCWLNKNKEENK